MARTTIDIDTPILEELKQMQKREGKTLGRLVSDLLARALAERGSRTAEPVSINWPSKPMRALIDIDDKEELWRVLDEDDE